MSFRKSSYVPPEHAKWFQTYIEPWYRSNVDVPDSDHFPENIQFALIEIWAEGINDKYDTVEEYFAWWVENGRKFIRNANKRETAMNEKGWLDENDEYVHPADEVVSAPTSKPEIGWEVADIVFRMPVKYQDLTKLMSMRNMTWAQAGRELGCDEETAKARWRLAREDASVLYREITDS